MAHHEQDGKLYVDSDFINKSQHVWSGAELKHMGFGEFYLETPDGIVEFDRMRGVDFPGKSGRSHQMYDRGGGDKASRKLLQKMLLKGKTERKAGLRSSLIRLAHDKPELRPALLPLLRTAGVKLKPGDTFHFIRGRNYGKQGIVTAVKERDGMVPGVDWTEDTGLKVQSLISEYEVKLGKAPRDMPWQGVDDGRKYSYVRRKGGHVYRVWEGSGYKWYVQTTASGWKGAWWRNAEEAKAAVDK